MTDENGDLEVGRVLVALDATVGAEAAVRAAAELAAGLRAELEALFVEDTNLLRLAALPFAREVGFQSAKGRPLDLGEVVRTLKSQASRMERMLTLVARQLQVQCSFRVTRGRVLPEALSQTRDADLLVLGRAGQNLTFRLAVRTGAAPPVMAVFDGTSRGYRALGVGVLLAARTGRKVLVLIPEPSRDRFMALRGRAQEWLHRRGHGANFEQGPGPDLESVTRRLKTLKADAVVLPEPREGISESQLRALLNAVDGEVLLAR